MFIQSFYMFPLNDPCLVDDEQSVVTRVISVKMLRQAENRREGRCSKTTINLLSSVTFTDGHRELLLNVLFFMSG